MKIHQYRPLKRAAAIAPWATSNATVDARGGWRAYAKEAADARRRERALKATEAQK